MRIDTFEKLLAMHLLQKANLPIYQTQVGATTQDITDVTNAADNMQIVKDYVDLFDAAKKTGTKIKQTVFNGDMDEEITKFPTVTVPVFDTPLLAGYLERANKRNRRFKAADGYTKEIGIALGIDGDTYKPAPESIVPTLEVFPAQTNYHAAIVVGNRGDSTMWKMFGRRQNEEKWTELASGTGKSADIQIAPTNEGKPERIEMQIRLYKNNEPYGQPSNPVYATLNP